MTEWSYNYDDILAHHGILGQKWGVRRYQNPDGTLTAAGRKRYRVDEEGNIVEKTRQERRAEAKQAKKDKAEAKRLRRLEIENETQEKKKERLLKERDITEIYKNREMFTTQELTEIYNRYNMERNISNLIPKEKEKSYSDTVDKLTKNIQSTANLVNAGTNAWNAFAKINNAISDSELPIIGGEKKKKETPQDKELKQLKEENERMKAIQNNDVLRAYMKKREEAAEEEKKKETEG